MSDELDTVTEVGVALLFTSLGPPSHLAFLLCSIFGVQKCKVGDYVCMYQFPQIWILLIKAIH